MIEKGYYNDESGSIFQISPDQRLAYNHANGHELSRKTNGTLPKMWAYYSSSALVVNMFGLIESLNLGGECWDSLLRLKSFFGSRKVYSQFEKKIPIKGVTGYTPNLDLYLCGGDRHVGIESKFMEMYRRKRKQKVSSQYIEKFPWWSEYQGLKKIATNVLNYTGDGRFDAAQLLKHCMALISRAKESGRDGKFRLVYIYHDIRCSRVAEEHSKALREFTKAASLGGRFISLTYNQYIERLTRYSSKIPSFEKYCDFLVKRYPLLTFPK